MLCLLMLDEAAIEGRRLWAELSAGIESVVVELGNRQLLLMRTGIMVVAAATLVRVMTIVIMMLCIQ